MTDADIVERVNAWITTRQRQGWASGNIDRSTAITWWLEVSRRYAADSPPAIGCLLYLVRVAVGAPGWCTEYYEGSWHGGVSGDGMSAGHPSEVALLVHALEAAP
jgi:hypothetical protein